MLVIVNGTGPWGEDYEAEMATSFCKELQKLGSGQYFRGPTQFGLQTFLTSKRVVRHIKDQIRGGDKSSVFLAGYSRGGAAVIYAAQLLKKDNIGVKAIFLYDAVDRTLEPDINVEVVPSNVATCYHARRDRKLCEHFKNDVTKATLEWEKSRAGGIAHTSASRLKGSAYETLRRNDMITRKFSRCENITEFEYYSLDFGNCGTRSDGACQYIEKLFLGTHGALGGAPEPEAKHGVRELADIDAEAMIEVRTWMMAALQKEGVLQPTTT